jgi:hypothetical protein
MTKTRRILISLASNTYYQLVLLSLIPAIFIVVLFYALKGSSPKTKIRLTCELLLIGILVFCFSFLILFLIHLGFQIHSEVWDHCKETIPDEKAYTRFLIPAISLLSLAVLFLSCGKFFKVKLTKLKRTVLLFFCLMPIVLAAFFIVIERELNSWLIIRYGIISALPCLLLNSAALLIGKPLLLVFNQILYRFNLLP